MHCTNRVHSFLVLLWVLLASIVAIKWCRQTSPSWAETNGIGKCWRRQNQCAAHRKCSNIPLPPCSIELIVERMFVVPCHYMQITPIVDEFMCYPLSQQRRSQLFVRYPLCMTYVGSPSVRAIQMGGSFSPLLFGISVRPWTSFSLLSAGGLKFHGKTTNCQCW